MTEPEDLGAFLDRDIPEELHLSRGIQAVVAQYTTRQLTHSDYFADVLSALLVNAMELEGRVVALERRDGHHGRGPTSG